MITQAQLAVRPATPNDRHQLANLIHFEVCVHRHLDWRPPLDWLGSQPYLIAEQNGNIFAVLACPPDPPEIAWIRLYAVASNTSVEKAWRSLWPAAISNLTGLQDLKWVAAIPLQKWFQVILEKSDFIQTHQVVMLIWDRSNVLPKRSLPEGISIRPMTIDDLPNVHQVDSAAFTPIWQISQFSLELAFHQAAVATVAESQGRMIGYQVSTATPLGGHLARLAVYPDDQGRGIGSFLVYDMLSQFERRGAQSVTVNTQKNNATSQSLYIKTGFRLTGEEYPVFQYNFVKKGERP